MLACPRDSDSERTHAVGQRVRLRLVGEIRAEASADVAPDADDDGASAVPDPQLMRIVARPLPGRLMVVRSRLLAGLTHKDYALPVAGPTREDVQHHWCQLIDGTLSREELHMWAGPWIEGKKDCDDPIVRLGLQHLHGFDLSRPTGTSRVLQQHGGGPGRVYLRSDAQIAAELKQWQDDARAFDHDPAEWRRHRFQQLHRGLLREGRPQEAHFIQRMLSAPDNEHRSS